MSILLLRSLKGTTSFDQVFRQCRKFTSGPMTAHIRFRSARELSPDTQQLLRMGVMVRKKVFPRAVDRNRVKRLIREAARLECERNAESFRSVDAFILSWHTPFDPQTSTLRLPDVAQHLQSIVTQASQWSAAQRRFSS